MREVICKEIEQEKIVTEYVKRFWQFSNPTADAQYYTILPDGYFDLITTIKASKLESITLFGLWAKEIEVVIPADTIIIGICLKPIAADYILQQNIAGLYNNFKSTSTGFWRINHIPFENFEKWTAEITNEILRNLSKVTAFDNRKQNIFHLLFQSNGSLTVEELSNQTFWSSRQINRYFKNKFGLTIKTYANILLCAFVYTDIRAGNLFPKKDFYDQAHFIKEIKNIQAVNQKNYIRIKMTDFYNFLLCPMCSFVKNKKYGQS